MKLLLTAVTLSAATLVVIQSRTRSSDVVAHGTSSPRRVSPAGPPLRPPLLPVDERSSAEIVRAAVDDDLRAAHPGMTDLDIFVATTPPGDVTWSRAKPVIRSQFQLAADERDSHIAWARDVDLDPSLATLPGAQEIVREYEDLLVELAADSFGLLQDSLYRYADLELFYKWEEGAPEPEIPADWSAGHSGRYSETWTSSWRNWRVEVAFDSAEFPVLEEALGEIERLQEECRSRVGALRVIAGDGD